jgi:3-hydroxymyristoyl/3-hydroxydecanoyl-(acyl carrier protein) dehydratase
MENAEVLETSGAEPGEISVGIKIVIPPESGYFDGHFPQIQVLPALAQFELVVRLASRFLGTGILVERIKRIKFSSLIRPGARLHIKLTYKERSGTLVFNINSPEGQAYSSGMILLRAGA